MESTGALQRCVEIVTRHWGMRAAVYLGDPKPAAFELFPLLPNENLNADLVSCSKSRELSSDFLLSEI